MQGTQLQRPIKDTLTSEWAKELPPTLKSSSQANFLRVSLLWFGIFSRCDYDYDYDDYDDGDDDNLFVTCDLPFPFHSGAPEWLFDAIVPFLEHKITSLYKYSTSLDTSLPK